jgi:hypothetical protein
MKETDLPERWTGKLKAYLREERQVNHDRLSAEDFPYHLKVNFEDGSFDEDS